MSDATLAVVLTALTFKVAAPSSSAVTFLFLGGFLSAVAADLLLLALLPLDAGSAVGMEKVQLTTQSESE